MRVFVDTSAIVALLSATGKKPKLSSECADVLRAAAGGVAGGLGI